MSETVRRLLSSVVGSAPLDAPASKGELVVVPPPAIEDETLEQLTTNIERGHDEIEQTLSAAAMTAVERGIEIGRRLQRAKKLAGHGNYEDWLARNFKFTPKTAQNYVRLFKQEAKLRQSLEEKRMAGSHLSMKDALELVATFEGKKKRR